MNIDPDKLNRANDLAEINQRIGQTLGLLQVLEDAAAQYLVLKVHASKGMGSQEGSELLAKARAEMFGKTISRMVTAGLFEADLKNQFAFIRNERNWLVHRSFDDKVKAMEDYGSLLKLMARLDSMAEAARALSTYLADEAEQFVLRAGITPAEIAKAMEDLRDSWSTADTN